MLQPGKRRFGRQRPSRVSRPKRRGLARSAIRILEDRRLAGSKSDRSIIREELVDRVRQEITAGTYDTRLKMEAAFERLLIEMAYD
jgi:anti-sigma28 factor (negative regulator of flagellin synthesis)